MSSSGNNIFWTAKWRKSLLRSFEKFVNQHSEQFSTSMVVNVWGVQYCFVSSFDSLISLCRFFVMLGSLSLKSNILARVFTDSSSTFSPPTATPSVLAYMTIITEIIKMEYYLLNVFFNLLIFFYHRMVNRKVWIECFVCIRSEFSIFQGLTRVVRMRPGRFVLVSTSDVYG